jgi:ankyrin repeat protein
LLQAIVINYRKVTKGDVVNIKPLIMLAAISSISSVCMELELEPKLELTINLVTLPPLKKPYHKLNFKNELETVDALTKDDAALLKTLVGIEQRGKYCESLHKAGELLRKWIAAQHKDNDDANAVIMSRCGSSFVSCIKDRQQNRKELLSEFNNNHARSFMQVLTFNPYIVNAYGCFKPYTKQFITPLHHLLLLAKDNHTRTPDDFETYIRMLLERGANPNAYDDEGNTSLHLAPTLQLALLLKAFGAKPSIRNKNGLTPLMYHIASRNNTIAKKLIYHSDSINKKDNEGNTALFYAVNYNTLDYPVSHSTLDIVRELLCNGARCTIPNKKGQFITDIASGIYFDAIENHLQTSICHALKNNKDIKKIINSKICIGFKIGNTPIMSWAKQHCRDAHGYLFPVVTKLNGILLKQISQGKDDTRKFILSKEDVSVNMIAAPPSRSAHTEAWDTLPIKQAIKQNNVGLVKLLLEYGAVVSQEMLTEAADNKDISTMLQDTYDNQCCYACKQKGQAYLMRLDRNHQMCPTCSSCAPKYNVYIS